MNKLINFHGFTLTQEQYDLVKDNFVNIPTQYEEEIVNKMIDNCLKALTAIDLAIGIDDYEACASSDEMFEVAVRFINDPMTQQVLKSDEVMTERYLEILTGIKCPIKEDEIFNMLYNYNSIQLELDKSLMH